VESRPPSPHFEALALALRQGEEDPGLARAALTLAAEFGPVNEAFALAKLDALAEMAPEAARRGSGEERLGGLLDWLRRERGFRGNETEYADPANSDLAQVLRRRTGLPITLAIVVIEVGARIGLPLAGVSFPGHFLVRTLDATPAIGDAFHGRLVDLGELRVRLHSAGRDPERLDPELFAAASTRDILLRMLNNLKHVFTGSRSWLLASGCCDRMLLLAPHLLTERRDRGLLYERAGADHLAADDLEAYLEIAGEVPEAQELRDRVATIRDRASTLH
jgi:regulator of sirC expression with transglutaminase-like and TPR domain